MNQHSIYQSREPTVTTSCPGAFHYLIAAQAIGLLYPNLNDDQRYMQRRLKRLVDNDYVLRLRALPMPRYGQAPHVFTLGRKGRIYLRSSVFLSSRIFGHRRRGGLPRTVLSWRTDLRPLT